jgi:uncharacterized protein (TIGR03437 family)
MAQFSDIAVTDDAGQIYFVSSLPLRGESGFGGGIYRWSGERWEQFVPPFFPNIDPFRRTYRVRPVVSGGGGIVAWAEEHRCQGGSSCISYPTYWDSVIATSDGQRISVPGRVQISRNGRFIIQAQEVYIFSRPFRVTRMYRDLQAGSAIELDFPPLAVLSDGRVLGSDANGLFLWGASAGRQRIAGTAGLVTPLISDNGDYLVAVRSALGTWPPELVAIAVDTGRPTSLGRGVPVGISNNGRRVLVLGGSSPVEPHSVDTLTGARTQLLPGTSVNAAAIAGSGHSAVLATTDGRLLKVSMGTGQSEELIARTPTLSLPGTASPCSAYLLAGSNLTSPAERPSVTLDAEPLLVLAVSEFVMWVQIPCELDLSPATRLLDTGSASPFGGPSLLQLRRYSPDAVGQALHHDFSGPVTWDRPARPGEIVHVWGIGFGPVDRVMRTGEPGPASPPARLLSPIMCREPQSGRDIEVLFAGLAPGLIGLYQLDLRIPADAREFYGVNCTLPENVSFSFLLPSAPSPATGP